MIDFSDNLKPVKFHHYRSFTTNNIIRLDFYSNSEIEHFRKELIYLFMNYGMKAEHDNKTVFECELFGNKICFGFYDWYFSIGFSYKDENEKGG